MARVQITAAMLSSNSLRQTVHTNRASIHQAAKLAAALLRVAGVTAGQHPCQNQLDLFRHFDRTLTCDRQRDRQTSQTDRETYRHSAIAGTHASIALCC